MAKPSAYRSPRAPPVEKSAALPRTLRSASLQPPNRALNSSRAQPPTDSVPSRDEAVLATAPPSPPKSKSQSELDSFTAPFTPTSQPKDAQSHSSDDSTRHENSILTPEIRACANRYNPFVNSIADFESCTTEITSRTPFIEWEKWIEKAFSLEALEGTSLIILQSIKTERPGRNGKIYYRKHGELNGIWKEFEIDPWRILVAFGSKVLHSTRFLHGLRLLLARTSFQNLRLALEWAKNQRRHTSNSKEMEYPSRFRGISRTNDRAAADIKAAEIYLSDHDLWTESAAAQEVHECTTMSESEDEFVMMNESGDESAAMSQPEDDHKTTERGHMSCMAPRSEETWSLKRKSNDFDIEIGRRHCSMSDKKQRLSPSYSELNVEGLLSKRLVHYGSSSDDIEYVQGRSPSPFSVADDDNYDSLGRVGDTLQSAEESTFLFDTRQEIQLAPPAKNAFLTTPARSEPTRSRPLEAEEKCPPADEAITNQVLSTRDTPTESVEARPRKSSMRLEGDLHQNFAPKMAVINKRQQLAVCEKNSDDYDGLSVPSEARVTNTQNYSTTRPTNNDDFIIVGEETPHKSQKQSSTADPILEQALDTLLNGWLSAEAVFRAIKMFNPNPDEWKILEPGVIDSPSTRFDSTKKNIFIMNSVPSNIGCSNSGEHWLLGIADVEGGTLELFDPLGPESRYLEQARKRVQLVISRSTTRLGQPVSLRQTYPVTSLQQRDSISCGIYVAVQAIFTMHHIGPPQSIDPTQWRRIFIYGITTEGTLPQQERRAVSLESLKVLKCRIRSARDVLSMLDTALTVSRNAYLQCEEERALLLQRYRALSCHMDGQLLPVPAPSRLTDLENLIHFVNEDLARESHEREMIMAELKESEAKRAEALDQKHARELRDIQERQAHEKQQIIKEHVQMIKEFEFIEE